MSSDGTIQLEALVKKYGNDFWKALFELATPLGSANAAGLAV